MSQTKPSMPRLKMNARGRRREFKTKLHCMESSKKAPKSEQERRRVWKGAQINVKINARNCEKRGAKFFSNVWN